MAFSDDDLRTIVETAKYSDPRASEYIITTLARRRGMIGRTFFSKLIQAPYDPLKPVSVYIRKQANHYKVVGIERSW